MVKNDLSGSDDTNDIFYLDKRKLQILLNGKYDKELKAKFYETFKIDDVTSQDKTSKELINALFEVFEEEIFKSEFELILRDMPFSEKKRFLRQNSTI